MELPLGTDDLGVATTCLEQRDCQLDQPTPPVLPLSQLRLCLQTWPFVGTRTLADTQLRARRFRSCDVFTGEIGAENYQYPKSSPGYDQGYGHKEKQ